MNNVDAEISDKCNADDQFERFDNLFRQVISVPKAAIDKEEAKLKRKKNRAKTAK